jgi:hypothetical protein
MDAYKNTRSELWFSTVDLARSGAVDLTRLPQETLQYLRSQALSPVWEMDSAGRRVVEEKKMTKKRLGRSPDGMDAMNLCYRNTADWGQIVQTYATIPKSDVGASGLWT